MKKNNYFLLALTLFTIGACTEEKVPQSIANSWQAKYDIEENSLVRSVASSNDSNMCLDDIFTSDTLRRQAANYEKRITGAPIKGQWKHLNLENLPIAQARFLKNFGDSIGDQANPNSINYEGCSSLPCIFNRIYQRDEFDVAGYVHYIWYLKFGVYLSLDNKVPEQVSTTPGVFNHKNFKVSDYLYNNDELFGFWRVTHMLEEPYTSLSNLKEIQRLPGKEAFEEERFKGACGLASSYGNIRLTSACLRIFRNDMPNSFLYIGLIHEMTHMLDYLQGKQGKNNEYFRSTQQDYIDLVGFVKQEYVNSNNELVISWSVKPGTKIIRDYSGETPIENFADTLAYFRQEGDETKTKITPAQFRWVSANYFQGESFDKQGNRSWLLKKYEKVFFKNILNTVVTCSSSQNKFISNYFSSNDFSKNNMNSNMLNCLSAEAEAMAIRMTAHIQIYEPDGCRTILKPDDKKLWNYTVKESLKKQFSVYVNEIFNDPEYLSRVKDFGQTLKNRSMANQALLECYNGNAQENLSTCYDLKVIEVSKKAALDLHISEQQAQEMSLLYLNSYPYGSVSQDLFLSYRTILNNHESLILEEAQDLWKMCLNTPHSDELKPSGNLFYPRKGYLISSIYNCLNTQLPSSLNGIIKAVSFDGEKITHPVEEKIMLEFLAPMLNERLYSMHESSMDEESEELAGKFRELSAGIRNNLISDFSWVTNLADQRAITESCTVKSLSQINALPLYHLKRDAFTNMILNGPCLEIMLTPEFKAFFDKSKEEIDTNVFNQIEKILEKNIENRALGCKQNIPWKWERTRATVRIPRMTCLNMGRNQIEVDTILELQKISTVTKFGITELELKSKISDLYESITSKIEVKHF